MTGGTNSQGKKIVVAVIDTDFDINHEDLLGNIFTNEGEIPGNGIDDDGNNFIDDFFEFFVFSASHNKLRIDSHYLMLRVRAQKTL